MSWLWNPIKRGVADGTAKGLSSFFERDRAADVHKPIDPLPRDLEARIEWAEALYRDAKFRASEEGPSMLGRLVAAGEMKILRRLVFDWNAERKRAQGMETRPGENGEAG